MNSIFQLIRIKEVKISMKTVKDDLQEKLRMILFI